MASPSHEAQYTKLTPVPFRGGEVHLETSKYFNLPDGSPGQGYWQAAVTLAHVVAEAEGGEAGLAGRRTVELGAGLGTTGLALALAGADVTLTDQTVVVDRVLRRNVESNVARVGAGADGLLLFKARARELNWGPEGFEAARDVAADAPYELVIGSEIVYEETAHEALLHTVQQLMGPDSVAYFGFKCRWLSDRAFFGELEDLGFECTNVPVPADKDWQRSAGALGEGDATDAQATEIVRFRRRRAGGAKEGEQKS